MNKAIQDTIIQSILSGKGDKVLNVLYKETLPKIRNMVIKNSGDKEEANDVFQDTVLIVFKQIRKGAFDASQDLEGYMYIIAKNLWKKRATNMNRNISMSEMDLDFDQANPVEVAITEEKISGLEFAMSKIGEECKRLLKMVNYEKLSMKEIASTLGFSSDDVAKSSHYRCKKKLADVIKSNVHLKDLYRS